MKESLGANTVVVPTPTWVIGTYDTQGRPNAMTVAWGGICCSQPPCVAISLRKATYTYRNLMNQKAFTISVPSEDYVSQADYFGLVSGKNGDKFAAAGLTIARSDLVNAPYIKEFPLIVECQIIHTVEIGLHTQFIGKILDVKADADVLNDAGKLDIKAVRPVIFTPGTNSYHGIGASLGKAFSVGKNLGKSGD